MLHTVLWHYIWAYACQPDSINIELVAVLCAIVLDSINPLQPNGTYRRRTAPLTSKRCILYICSTNIGTEYFKYGIYSQLFPLQNAVCFIILIFLVPVLLTF